MRRLGQVVSVVVAAALSAPAVAAAFSDPTQPMDFDPPARTAREAPAGPVLQSTLVSPHRRFAVISGKRVRVGDRVNGAVVTDIFPYEVRMTRDGRETTLRLLPKLIKEKEAVK
jgi:MSHA biogenesis protein MshK